VSERTISTVPFVLDEVVAARAAWSQVVRRGQTLRIVDLGGNQAVDCLLYNADDLGERYSAPDTISAQRNIFLVTGTQLMSNEGRALMTITATTCAYHDTIGGACSRESNTLRYGHHTAHQHACVDNFLDEGMRRGLTKRDLVPNINWFMNVPVDADGTLGIVDGISSPGLSVDVRADMDVLVLISNCPQINNPCNGFDPTPVRVIVLDGC
jgi:urea carboxylase-associated protein 1